MTLSRQLALVLGFTQMTSWATTYYVPAVMTAPVAAALGVSSVSILGGFSIALLTSGIGAPWMGRQIERRGGRPILVAGAVLQAAGLLTLAAAQGLAQWYAGWLILGLGMSAGLYDAAFAAAG
ncbi:MAG: MFS transporter, partial [Gemmatimonadaceae bacterium]|nr:MFS transporter [Acetobacteraceae bacterium]